MQATLSRRANHDIAPLILDKIVRVEYFCNDSKKKINKMGSGGNKDNQQYTLPCANTQK